MPHHLSTSSPTFPPPPAARHYHPALSIWLSVDPMSDKYPSTSPYVYCGNNPVRLVDPDGRDIWIVGEDGNKYKYSQGQLFDKNGEIYSFRENSFEGKAVEALNTLRTTKMGNKLVSAFEGSDNPNVTISFGEHSSYSKEQGTISWQSNGTELLTTAGKRINATTDLGHEFSHAFDDKVKINYTLGSCYGLSTKEWKACYRENCIRKELGLPLRTYYYTYEDIYTPKRGSPPFLLLPVPIRSDAIIPLLFELSPMFPPPTAINPAH